MKAAIEREESDARINFPEREQARLKVKSEKYKLLTELLEVKGEVREVREVREVKEVREGS